jgi:hypothetical protein
MAPPGGIAAVDHVGPRTELDAFLDRDNPEAAAQLG